MQDVHGPSQQAEAKPVQAPRLTQVKGAKTPQSGRRSFRKSKSTLTVEEKRDRDARMQHFINVLRIHRVYRAAQASGWFSTPFEVFQQYLIEDYPDRMECVDPVGGRYRVEKYDAPTNEVWLRKIGNHG